MKGSKPLAFLKIFGRGCLPECIHLTALLGTIFLVIFICDSATARTLSERASITGNVSFQGKAVDTDLDCAIALKEGDDIGRQDTPTYSVRLGPEGSFAINGLRKTLDTLVIYPSIHRSNLNMSNWTVSSFKVDSFQTPPLEKKSTCQQTDNGPHCVAKLEVQFQSASGRLSVEAQIEDSQNCAYSRHCYQCNRGTLTPTRLFPTANF